MTDLNEQALKVAQEAAYRAWSIDADNHRAGTGAVYAEASIRAYLAYLAALGAAPAQGTGEATIVTDRYFKYGPMHAAPVAGPVVTEEDVSHYLSIDGAFDSECRSCARILAVLEYTLSQQGGGK